MADDSGPVKAGHSTSSERLQRLERNQEPLSQARNAMAWVDVALTVVAGAGTEEPPIQAGKVMAWVNAAPPPVAAAGAALETWLVVVDVLWNIVSEAVISVFWGCVQEPVVATS